MLYREEHARQRAVDEPVEAHPHLTVKKADGSIAPPLDLGLMKQQVEQAATGLDGINGDSLVEDACATSTTASKRPKSCLPDHDRPGGPH